MDRKLLMDFLKEVDRYFSPNLSQKTELSVFCDKLLRKAKLFVSYSGGGKIIGLVALYANDFSNRYAYIPIVAVHKDFRNKGIAKTLVESAISYVRSMSRKEIRTLGIHTNNEVALHLYLEKGFVKLDEKDGRSYLEMNF